jgi:hypothetical protein
MKQTLSILMIAVMLFSCGSSDQNKATEQANQVQSTIKPGSIPTTANGYTMKAKLNGKNWTACSMMPAETVGRIIGYYKGEYIGLPFSNNDMVVGRKNSFGEDNAVDLLTNDDNVIWDSQKGEMEITRILDNWAEGKFFFTVRDSRSGKTIELTDGFFRIALERK